MYAIAPFRGVHSTAPRRSASLCAVARCGFAPRTNAIQYPNCILTLSLQITLGVILQTSFAFLSEAVDIGFADVNAKGLLPTGYVLEYIFKDEGDQGARARTYGH